jgi:3-isopropylmalate/(R)-2-methylmalate dehydratase small subunit
MYNCGMIAAEAEPGDMEEIFGTFASEAAVLRVDIGAGILEFQAPGKSRTLPLVLSDFEKALIQAGGWVEYAAAHY